MSERHAGRRGLAVASAVTMLVAALPLLPGILAGRTLYFRDLAGEYFPYRRLAAEGLRAGRLTEWNPYVHEGVPLTLPAIGYPVDLLHALWPDERLFSLVLALHVPLGAAAFLVLARSLGLCSVAAAGGALVYALGGFSLSALNLYRYAQAMAWAPLLVWALGRAGQRDARRLAVAAAVTGLALCTTGIEVVLLSVVAALVLARPVRPAAAWGWRAAALGLGVLAAAAVLLPLRAFAADSARGAGFTPDVVLAHSVHPFTLLQVVIGGLYGDLGNLPGRFWGSNFFPRGFPYVLSLYLGVAALAVAVVGVRHAGAARAPLLALLGLGVVVCLGRWAGLGAVVELSAALRVFRYPVKAFFLVHLSVALLAAWGLDALRRSRQHAWRWLAAASLAAGALLVSAPWWPRLLPAATRWFLLGFFPPEQPLPLRLDQLQMILRDAAAGGVAALAVGACAVLAARGRLPARTAAVLVTAVMAADLVRTGAGLNRTVSPAFFELSPEMTAQLGRMRDEGGRVFTCDVPSSRAYVNARSGLGDRHELWTFAALVETLTPSYNLRHRLPSAYSPDLTMLVPEAGVLAPEEASCVSFATLEARLREAGVAHVVSVDALDSPALALAATVRPARIAPLAVHVYRLGETRPLREVVGSQGSVTTLVEDEDRLELRVAAAAPSTLLLREGYGAGWTAWVDGRRVTVSAANGRHRAVAVPGGTSRVVIDYRPVASRAGLVISLLAVAALLALWLDPRRMARAAAALPARVAKRWRRPRPAAPVPAGERRLALAGWAALVAVTTAPYVFSLRNPPAGTEFTGIFYYRDDFYQYVSFAEQVQDGALLFRNKFDTARRAPVLVNLEWWAAGALGVALGGPVAGFHALRLLALYALVAAALRVLTLGGLSGAHRAWALALFLSAGGLGWLRLWTGTPGWQIPDIAMGFYPFHQSLTNAHFVVGTALLIWSLILLVEWREGRRGAWPWLATAAALGLCRPYDLVTFTLMALALCAWDAVRPGTRAAAGRRALPLLWLLPVFAYYGVLVGMHPSYRTWGGQTMDVSPPRYQYIFALLPTAAVWAFCARRLVGGERAAAPLTRALLAWWLVLAVLLVTLRSALTKQSVITMGAAVLLLAGLHLPRRWLPWTALAAAPTSAFLVWRLFHPWPDCFAPPEYFQAARTLAKACSPHDVALAPTDLSLMIAGLTPCSVALGHRTLTPHYERHLQDGDRFYHDRGTTAAWRREYLDRLSAAFVVLPAGGGALLGADPPYAPILRTGLLEVWERGPAATARR
jgi:hypothetical protein